MNDKNKALQTTPAITPATLLSQATDKGLKPEEMKEYFELYKDWEANEAKKAYVVAMNGFKKNPPVIKKDMENSQYGSKYTTLANLINTATPELSKHGLSHRWDIDQDEKIKVTCILTHKKGHSEKTSASAPPDDSGKKNEIQKIKSTITYLKSVTFESITGLASTDANFDDDGNAAGMSSMSFINSDQQIEIQDLIDETYPDKGVKFFKWISKVAKSEIKSVDQIYAGQYKMIINNFKKIKEKS